MHIFVMVIYFAVCEVFQVMRISSFLLRLLESVARENGYTGFQASVPAENSCMIRVFRNRYPDAFFYKNRSEVHIIMDFDNHTIHP